MPVEGKNSESSTLTEFKRTPSLKVKVQTNFKDLRRVER